ncbi:unnamed protein product [Caenorhabditis auriculariae]|uniref:Uncharacterized protein n=1 Tax=Caenorhabditis auriculariae TaxID=2777116 RepID=A0A8S1GYE1_9PELO|nr:unnamed protein product [Caenorhabditis auriculariae]
MNLSEEQSLQVDVGAYDSFFHVFYAFYALISVSSNFLLIYLLKNRSPSRMKVFKWLLINTSVSQIGLALLNFFVQERILPSGEVLALLPIGPCFWFGNKVCFVGYNLINVFNMIVGLSILHSMHFRYRLIRETQAAERMRLGRPFFLSLLLPAFLLVTPFFDMYGEAEVMEETRNKHPNYVFHSSFGGFKSVRSPLFLINSAILSATAITLPLITFYWRCAILKTIKDKPSSFKQRTKNSSRALVKVLTLQAVIPSLCYLPIAVLYPCAQFLDLELPQVQYLTTALPAMSCAIDPILSIYFIAPYRKWVASCFKGRLLKPSSLKLNRLCPSTLSHNPSATKM